MTEEEFNKSLEGKPTLHEWRLAYEAEQKEIEAATKRRHNEKDRRCQKNIWVCIMSELRRAVLSVDVIGSALRDIKDIRKEWEELKSRGAIPIDLKVNVSQTGQTLDVLARQVRDATVAI